MPEEKKYRHFIKLNKCIAGAWHAMPLLMALVILFSCEKPEPLPVLGQDPITDPLIVEDHGQALARWAEQGIRDAVLINIDTHDDIRWIPEAKIKSLKDMYSRRDWNGFTKEDPVADRTMYHEGNWIYAGARLGIIKEVYWMIPQKLFSKGRGERPSAPTEEELRRYLQSAMFSVQDIETFALEGNQFRGSFQSIPITLCGLESLPVVEGPVMLRIDIDFFPEHSKKYRVTYLTALHNMFQSLYSRNYRIQDPVVSCSVNGDYLPPHLRWLGDAVAMILENPGSLDEPPLELLTLLQEIDNAYRTVNSGEMLKFTEHYFSRYPEASMMLYKAYAYMLQGDSEKALAAAMESCNADKEYCPGLPYMGSLYFVKKQCEEGIKFFRAGYSADPAMRNGLYHFAHCLRDLGNVQEAMRYYKKDVILNGSFPTDFLIFETLFLSGEGQEAIAALDTAVRGLKRNPYAEVVNKRAADAIYAAIDYGDQNGLKEMTETLLNNRTIKQMFIDYPRL